MGHVLLQSIFPTQGEAHTHVELLGAARTRIGGSISLQRACPATTKGLVRNVADRFHEILTVFLDTELVLLSSVKVNDTIVKSHIADLLLEIIQWREEDVIIIVMDWNGYVWIHKVP